MLGNPIMLLTMLKSLVATTMCWQMQPPSRLSSNQVWQTSGVTLLQHWGSFDRRVRLQAIFMHRPAIH